jgi:alpha-tubulin suppressor-like RCC1 family protein
MMPPGITFTSVSAGGQHTCALASNGSAWCWGRNNFQIGDSTNSQRLTPVRVAAPTGITFSAIAAGNQHNCAVTAGGDAYCWGTNGNGRLGDGTTVSKNHPVRVLPAAPIQFAGVTAGEFHSCGWTSAGAASCWGRNDNGQLGDNSVIQRLLPTAVAGALSFASLTAGNEHTCGRTSAGAVHCWGKNAYGQLGDGTLVNKLVPTAVLGSLSLGITSAGSQHTCGFTSGASAGIWCWGLNEDGQLGDGTVITRLQATRTVH